MNFPHFNPIQPRMAISRKPTPPRDYAAMVETQIVVPETPQVVHELDPQQLPKRRVPTERPIDRLWRTMGKTARCQWLDRDVQHVTFWFDLFETFGNDFHPERAGHHFIVSVKTPKSVIKLSTVHGEVHQQRICFVHKNVFHLRTTLTPKLLDWLHKVEGDPSLLSLVLRTNAKPRGRARRFGPERIFPIIRAHGPLLF
ncbi:MAG: hypothetical protein WCK01_01080 [Candidatus Uhrbacteria bacterium]